MLTMRNRPARVDWLFACALTLAANSAGAQGFRDDFNGAALDTSRWVTEVGSGETTVAGGFLTLSCEGSTFPVVMTRTDPFPTGDFRVRIGLRYVAQGFCGDGVGAIDNFWEDYYGVACRPFLLWQDTGGLYVYSGSPGSTPLAPAPETQYHVVEWTYTNGVYEFTMDGQVRAQGECAPRATGLFFGHPHPVGCSGAWSQLAVDFVEIAPTGATAAKRATWGALKIRYRL